MYLGQWLGLVDLGAVFTLRGGSSRPSSRSSRTTCSLCLESLEERNLLSQGPSIPSVLAQPITQVLIQTSSPGGPGSSGGSSSTSGGTGSSSGGSLSGGSSNSGGPGYPLPPPATVTPPTVCVQAPPMPVMPPLPSTNSTTATAPAPSGVIA